MISDLCISNYRGMISEIGFCNHPFVLVCVTSNLLFLTYIKIMYIVFDMQFFLFTYHTGRKSLDLIVDKFSYVWVIKDFTKQINTPLLLERTLRVVDAPVLDSVLTTSTWPRFIILVPRSPVTSEPRNPLSPTP